MKKLVEKSTDKATYAFGAVFAAVGFLLLAVAVWTVGKDQDREIKRSRKDRW